MLRKNDAVGFSQLRESILENMNKTGTREEKSLPKWDASVRFPVSVNLEGQLTSILLE